MNDLLKAFWTDLSHCQLIWQITGTDHNRYRRITVAVIGSHNPWYGVGSLSKTR